MSPNNKRVILVEFAISTILSGGVDGATTTDGEQLFRIPVGGRHVCYVSQGHLDTRRQFEERLTAKDLQELIALLTN